MRSFRTTFLVAALIVVLTVLSTPGIAGQTVGREVRDATDSWLALVDSGNYAESWSTAAAYVRHAMAEGAWEAALRGARAPLGAIRTRTLASTTAATTLPGAPDGNYLVFQFTTTFDNKQSATETVTAVLEPDGVWRIAGYFIR